MSAVIPPRLESILAEANRIAPNRRKNSDGTIGDQAHQQRTSDHNPAADPGTSSPLIVHAVDVSQSVPGNPFCTPAVVNFALPGSVFDAHARGDAIAREYIAATPAQRAARFFWLKYLVSHNYQTGRAKIFDPSVSIGWRDQPGDPHLSHLHTSIQHAHAAEQFTGPIFSDSTPPEEDVTPEQMKELVAMVKAALLPELKAGFGGPNPHKPGQWTGTVAAAVAHELPLLVPAIVAGVVAELKR